jgi:DNA-binding NarL/FixJ family response regulator
LQRAIITLWPVESATCASLSDIAQVCPDRNQAVVLLSIVSLTEQEADAQLAQLLEVGPSIRSMVLARTDDLNDALTALSQGANGYISMSAGFEIFIQALRFVGAGGNYVPTQCLLATKQAPAALPDQAFANGITSREMAVIQAIRQGKPNKVIAYELNMCESTVKVHVRHIMRKLHAKNRTDVAIKGAALALPARPEPHPMTMSRVTEENQGKNAASR